MSDPTTDPIKVAIDLTAPSTVNAEKVIRGVTAWSPRSEEQIANLTKGLSSMVNQLYREAWTLAEVPLARSGMSDPQIEETRLAILFGAWVEVVDTIRPGVFELLKITAPPERATSD